MASYKAYTDQELVSLLKEGDERAFDELFRKMYPGLSFFAGRFVPHMALAEEIVQDVMLKLWNRRADFDTYHAVKAFLYIATKNACMDRIDSEQRKQQRDHKWYTGQEQLDLNVEEHMIQTEVVMEISRAIEKLPEQCRKIIRMSYEQGMSGKEIADQMQISVSTVNNQKARGILLLRKMLSTKGLAVLIYLFDQDW